MASSSPSSPAPAAFPPISSPLITPIVVALGFLAFFSSGFDGFGRGLGASRAVPIYAYFSLLLLLLQIRLWEKASWLHAAYVLLSSGVAIVFAAILAFVPSSQPPLLNNPPIYIVANILLFAVFLVDAVRTRRSHPAVGTGTEALARSIGSDDVSIPTDVHALQRVLRTVTFFAWLAADCVGFALLAVVVALSLNFLQMPPSVLGKPPGTRTLPHIPVVYLPHPLGPVTQLWQFDLALALASAFLAMFSIITVAWLLRSALAVPIQVGNIVREAATQVLLSLRLFTFFAWLAAALVIALLSQQVSDYFKGYFKGAGTFSSSGSVGDLFNPLPLSHFNLAGVLTSVALGLFAVVCVAVAAAFAEQSAAIIPRVLALFGAAGRRLAFTGVFFIYGLAFANALAVLFGVSATPFQVGAAGFISLLVAGVVFAVYALIGRGRQG